MRPSGTEPKIKFYFGVKSSLSNAADFEKTKSKLQGKIEAIISDLKL
jgi:phosphoglucomutase